MARAPLLSDIRIESEQQFPLPGQRPDIEETGHFRGPIPPRLSTTVSLRPMKERTARPRSTNETLTPKNLGAHSTKRYIAAAPVWMPGVSASPHVKKMLVNAPELEKSMLYMKHVIHWGAR
jgi:hypothetical protein